MKKQEENKVTLKNQVIILLVIIMLTACMGAGDNTENAINSTGENMVQTVQEQRRPGAGRETVLIWGNHRVYGIPGFEDNSFHALAGEYRLQTDVEGKGNNFLLYLSLEPLYFSREWQTRHGTGNYQAYQRSTDDEFLVSLVVNDGKGVLWAVIFSFSHEFEETVLNSDALNQFFRVWSNRFLYFLSFARTLGEISIPAVVRF